MLPDLLFMLTLYWVAYSATFFSKILRLLTLYWVAYSATFFSKLLRLLTLYWVAYSATFFSKLLRLLTLYWVAYSATFLSKILRLFLDLLNCIYVLSLNVSESGRFLDQTDMTRLSLLYIMGPYLYLHLHRLVSMSSSVL